VLSQRHRVRSDGRRRVSGPPERLPRWLDRETLDCGDVHLQAVFDSRSAELQSTPSRFVLGKSPEMVDWYRRHFAGRPPRTVFEVGIFKGGSVVLFEELWHPERLVAVDITERRVDALDEYIERTGAGARVRPYYGVDQADADALGAILRDELSGAPIDVVIDDGCHYLEESRATFEALFPWVAPGGQFIIEDWAWAHWEGIWQEAGGPWRERSSMTLLVLELAVVSASRPDLVASVEVDRDLVVVHKGTSAPVGEPVLLAGAALTAGRVYYETLGAPESEGGRGEGRPLTAALITDPSGSGSSALSVIDRARAAEQAARSAEAKVRCVENSRSWRFTAPLRVASAALRRRAGA
jgi:SAM-dependent methyltransferase